MRKRFALALAVSLMCTGLAKALPGLAQPLQPTVTTPTQALERLKAGNQRFTDPSNEAFVEERKVLAGGQRPHAILLGCSDSRTPPEHIFDEGLGDLFVVRVAGNVVEPATMGSIEYAAEHLHAPLIVVMGHGNCGAVKAALAGDEAGGKVGSPDLHTLLSYITPAVRATAHKQGDSLALATEENVRVQMCALGRSAVLRHLVETRQLAIVGGIYELRSGAVHWVKP